MVDLTLQDHLRNHGWIPLEGWNTKEAKERYYPKLRKNTMRPWDQSWLRSAIPALVSKVPPGVVIKPNLPRSLGHWEARVKMRIWVDAVRSSTFRLKLLKHTQNIETDFVRHIHLLSSMSTLRRLAKIHISLRFVAGVFWEALPILTHRDTSTTEFRWGNRALTWNLKIPRWKRGNIQKAAIFFCMLVFRGVHSREVTYNAKCEKEHHLQECRLGIWTCSQQGYSLWKESHNTNIWSFWGIFRCNHALFGLVIKNYSLWMGNHVNRTLKKQHLTRSMGKNPIEQPKSPTAFVVISLPKSWKLCFWAILGSNSCLGFFL